MGVGVGAEVGSPGPQLQSLCPAHDTFRQIFPACPEHHNPLPQLYPFPGHDELHPRVGVGVKVGLGVGVRVGVGGSPAPTGYAPQPGIQHPCKPKVTSLGTVEFGDEVV